MNGINIGPIIPLRLQRKINRLIEIGDILDEDSTKNEEDDVPERDDSSSLVNNINIEPRLKPKPLYETKTNWIQEFCENTRKDRIIWRSKLHAKARKFENKSMYEQVEELMDISALDFAECINKLTDDKQHQISKEMIKKLFSIDIENDISRSLHMQKIQRPVVSQELADMFECPELCIERNVRRLMEENKKLQKIKPKLYAFGRCLSPTSKREIATKFEKPEPFTFPDDIRSGENLFKGIDHLKSTKELLKYLEANNLPKPKYLVKMNALNAKFNDMSRYTPLHSFYQ